LVYEKLVTKELYSELNAHLAPIFLPDSVTKRYSIFYFAHLCSIALISLAIFISFHIYLRAFFRFDLVVTLWNRQNVVAYILTKMFLNDLI